MEEKKPTYREQVIQVIENLFETRQTVFCQLLDLGLSNEFSDIGEAFDIGDTYTFSLDHFDDATDSNLISLIELCRKFDQTISTLMNLNQIDDNEIDF